jgi:hypothetical protein
MEDIFEKYDSYVTAQRKAAKILFSVLLLFVAAIILLNFALQAFDDELESKIRITKETENRLGKLRAYRSLNADFFQGLTHSALWPSLLSRKVHYNSIGTLDRYVSETEEDAEKFALIAVEIFQKTKDVPTRSKLLKDAVNQYFRNETIRERLGLVLPLYMAEVDDSGKWRNITLWISHEFWPPPSAFGYGRDFSRGYTGRFRRHDSYIFDKSYVHSELELRGPENSEEFLLTEWRKAELELREFKPRQPNINVFGGAFPIAVEQILIFAAPILCFTHLVFFVHWMRVQQASKSILSAKKSSMSQYFSFPRYGSPTDPLCPPTPRTFSEFVERCIWLGFLVGPLFLYVIAIITQFDLRMDWRVYGSASWLEVIAKSKAVNAISFVLDLVVLACFLLSLVIVISITSKQTRVSKLKHSELYIVIFVATVVIGFIAVVISRTVNEVNTSVFARNIYVLWGFGGAWIVGSVWAYIRDSRTGMVVCGIGSLAFFFLATLPTGQVLN